MATAPVKVLHLCAVDFTVRQFIAPLVLELQRSGYDVRAACTKGPHWEELAQMGVRMVEMPVARSANPIRAAASVWRLYRWLRSERIDILHVHTPVASLVGRLAAWLARVPIVVYTAHGFYFHDQMPARKRRIHIAMEWLAGRVTSALFCVSSEDAREAVKLGIMPRGRTAFVSNGVDHRRFNPDAPGMHEAGLERRRELGIPAGAWVIAIMGRLVREKGYMELFEAARTLFPTRPDVHLLVVGDTVVSEHDDAKAQIAAAARAPELLGRVHFAGLRRDIPELLAASNLFVLPSYREGMPVSILEAMMMRLPVVATRIRGCREEVVDGETGFLVTARSSEELAGAISHLADHRERAAAMGLRGRERAMRHFREDRVLRHQLRLYTALLRRRRR